MDIKGPETCPLPLFTDVGLHLDGLTLGGGRQLFPFIHGGQ